MKRGATLLVVGALGMLVAPPATDAILTRDRLKCQKTIASAARKYVASRLQVIQRCLDAELASPGSCPAPNGATLQGLADDLRAALAKRCSFDKLGPGFDDDNLEAMGFPGPCSDANPIDGFTLADLQACILESHDRILAGVCRGGTNVGEACSTILDCPDQGGGALCQGIVTTQYDPSFTGPPSDTAATCQGAVAKNATKFFSTVLKAVQACRNAFLDCKAVQLGGNTQYVCKRSGFDPQACATLDPKTATTIAKARTKAIAAMESKCSDADAVQLALCTPDQPTAHDAALCEVQVHQDLADNADAGDVHDLIDFEYVPRGVCGDNRRNSPSEDCDGIADADCPGECGAADGFFPCLCQNAPRTRVIEHANADLDNGWTGLSHDSGIVEGGGYVTDLYDCDGPGGPDTVCTVGPSCSLPPHAPCSPPPDATGSAANADSICASLGQGTCRKTAGGATGPHCETEFKRRCKSDPDCPLPGDRCVKTPHGAPLPLVSGAVSVCVVNTFSEDVVGTTDLATGAGAVRLRQDSATYTGGTTQQPCPVCGGFCSGAASETSPGARNLCATDADCKSGSTCIHEPICSWGPDIGRPCRRDPPGGGPTQYFGNPSVDCRMGGNPLGGRPIDILFDPATTETTTLTANLPCLTPGFNEKRCAGGPNQHAVCTLASECPGGSCNHQCFCPNVPGQVEKPTACERACVGGANDAEPCITDDDCTGGFCHPGDCRLNPADTDSAQEGLCTVGPDDGHCSEHPFVGCQLDAACRPPTCAFCTPTETCTFIRRQCFVNPTIVRIGSVGVPDRTSVATFCITPTGEDAVDTVAGLPGPGAITNPMTILDVGF